MRSTRSVIATCTVWFSIAAIFMISLIIYHPSLNIGFWTDDFGLVELAGRLSVPDYLRVYFDPQVQWRWYRPIQGIAWWFGYVLFRNEPVGYHVAQILWHASNAALLLLLATRVTRKLFIGFAAALLYLTFPVDGLAVYWPAVVDPLLASFYLSAIWFWMNYAEQPTRLRYGFALAAFVAALLAKEVAVTLLPVLFLADRWLIDEPVTLPDLAKRYVPFIIALGAYAFLEFHALTQGIFTTQLGYGFGSHILPALMFQLSVMAFPWYSLSGVSIVVVLTLVGACIYFALKREFRILFLASAGLFTLLPTLPFQPNLALNGRYLYLPLMASAVVFALIVDWVVNAIKKKSAFALPRLVLLGFILILVSTGSIVLRDSESFGNSARADRLLFRPIFDKHPTFAPGTFLYFIDPPDLNAASIMFVRYGANIQADTTLHDHIVELRNHTLAQIFYLDDGNNWYDQVVNKNTNVHSSPNLPIRFDDGISLDGYELVSDRVHRGDAVIAILYWHTDKKIDRDYTIFAHLVDRDGRLIAGADKQPRNGNYPTSAWRPNAMLSDAIIITMPSDMPLEKDLRLEIGLYDFATFKRLALIGTADQPMTDMVTIAPILVIE